MIAIMKLGDRGTVIPPVAPRGLSIAYKRRNDRHERTIFHQLRGPTKNVLG